MEGNTTAILMPKQGN